MSSIWSLKTTTGSTMKPLRAEHRGILTTVKSISCLLILVPTEHRYCAGHAATAGKKSQTPGNMLCITKMDTMRIAKIIETKQIKIIEKVEGRGIEEMESI